MLEEIPWLKHGFGTRLSKSWTHDTNLTTVRQIHSGRVLIANGNDGVIGEGDALVSDKPFRRDVSRRALEVVS